MNLSALNVIPRAVSAIRSATLTAHGRAGAVEREQALVQYSDPVSIARQKACGASTDALEENGDFGRFLKRKRSWRVEIRSV